MRFNVEKLKQIAEPLSDENKQRMEFRRENGDWLRLSAMFALKLRHIMDAGNISQAELAKRMEVTPAQVTKILSGKENLQLKTIAKVNKAVGCDVVDFSLEDGFVSNETYRRNNEQAVALTCFISACGKPYRAMYGSEPVFKGVQMVSNLC